MGAAYGHPRINSMSGYTINPESIVNQIRNNLLDRYDSGYPILKELLQNADDAGAHRFRLDARVGWPDAENPLLRGPGLLIVNDGEFRPKDRKGILSFGESVKANDDTTIGKFGFGQKAVFHLCDAFAVHAFGQTEPFMDVVNPFEDVEVRGNVTGEWKTLSDSDAGLLRDAAADFCDHGLILWLPLRRNGLRPAPAAGFSSNRPTIEETVQQVDKPDDLRSLLTTLRHLRDVEIRENGETRRAVRVLDGDRLLGPKDDYDWREGARTFAGAIETGPGASKEKFVAREAMLQDGRMEGLKSSNHWPRTHSALSSTPTPEKGEPHGAATLLRVAGPPSQSVLKIAWAVFLPVSETDGKSISIDGPDLGCFRLLLHGYFFLDSGRRHIEGLQDPAPDVAPSDAAGLRRAWNAELRDSVVLPLVPALLLDALTGRLAMSAELAAVTAAVARDDWFCKNRRAICRNGALARVLEAPSSVPWRIVPAGTKLRPLPRSIADHPERMKELFEDVHAWADGQDIVLCVDQDAALTAEPMRWTSEELGSLFDSLASRVFSSRALAALLADFLDLAVCDDDDRREIGSHVVRALRAALRDTAPLAPSEHVERIIGHVPRTALVRLPKSVEHRQVLRVLANCDAAVLPVNGAWVSEDARSPRIPLSDIEAFLRALEPLVESPGADASANTDTAEQAATAALALVRQSSAELSILTNHSRFADVKVLRGLDPRVGRTLALSIADLAERSRNGLLFGPSPEANEWLPLLMDAALDAKPVIIHGKTAKYLKEAAEQGGSIPQLLRADKDALLSIINETEQFGNEAPRAELLKRMNPGERDDREALRRLCVGYHDAGEENAELRVLSETTKDVERIVCELFRRRSNQFLVPSRIADVLSVQLLRRHLGIDVLDEPRIEALLKDNLDEISRLEPTEQEREALLRIDLPDSLLRRLPIHVRPDGAVGDAVGVYREADWPIPEALKKEVVTVRPCRSQDAQKRQKDVIPAWSPKFQIETALRQPEPHVFREEILGALAELPIPSAGEEDRDLIEQLREQSWLVMNDVAVSPKDVLDLPPGVGEQAAALPTVGDETPAFVLADALPDAVKRHPGFRYVEKHLLPDKDDSLAALARRIAVAGLVGLLGTGGAENAGLVDDLAALAKNNTALALPGWPLLAAVLASLDPAQETVRDIVSSFRPLTSPDHETAARHLDALATLAAGRAAEPERKAARRVYEHGFEAIAGWPDDARRKVFGGASVPTEDGGWRTGREVVEYPNGIAPTHVLDQKLARMLRKRRAGDASDGALNVSRTSPAGPNQESSAPLPAVRSHDGFTKVDLNTFEVESAEEQRRFLRPWKSRLPADLVIVYLGLIGRYRPMREVAKEWRSDATTDVDTLWDALDQRMKPSRGGTGGPNPLRKEIDDRRFCIREITGKVVPAIALSSDRFEAPLADEASGLIVGNAHTQPRRIRSIDDAQRKLLIEIGLRRMEPGRLSPSDAVKLFRQLVETIAIDCHHWFMSDSRDAFTEVLDKATRPDQTTLEDTEALLRDRLPTILAEMKLLVDSVCRRELHDYQQEEGRIARLSKPADRAQDLAGIKENLWERIGGDQATAELLASIRGRIEDLGYTADRVLFELFQNADDAYAQLDGAPADSGFRVEDLGDRPGILVTHWGRLINHRGTNVNDGDRLGRDRDLLNMLVLNFSEKPTENLTGKFGLGFKSVHLLSDGVGIASGGIALRTRGGFLPYCWVEGMDEAERRRGLDGRPATVIEIPFARSKANEGERSFRAFRNAMTWLPAFARRIRRIDVAGVETVHCTASLLTGQGAVKVITVSTTARTQQALQLDLGGGHSLLLAVDREGPCAFPNALRRLWNLAPLEENLHSGWLLNGPFAVDPGRGRLAGSVAVRQERFQELGQTFGERLLELYDRTETDWKGVAEALVLDSSAQDARQRFWERLFDVVSRDFDDDLARFLHAPDLGYGRLAAERRAVPTGLPAPFDVLVRASGVRRVTDGALADSTVLAQVSSWSMLADLKDRIVAMKVSERLKKIGFRGIRPVSLSDLLHHEMGDENRIDADVAMRLGTVVTLEAIEKEPLLPERKAVLDAARQAKFRARDESWRPVKELNSESGGADEKLICGFAPDHALLHRSYAGAALEFFRVARSTSGYGPRSELLCDWAARANDPDRRKAALRYVVSGRQGREMAGGMRGNLPDWAPGPLDSPQSNPLLAGWSEEDTKRLLFDLRGHHLLEMRPVSPDAPRLATGDAVGRVLSALHEWWVTNRDGERNEYARRVYPEGFSPARLRNREDRASWFTMFALACFQAFGRAQDWHHRSFIDNGYRGDWWREIAESRPPDEVQPWLTRLERWSGAEWLDQDCLRWRRTLVDLYTIARWLNVYTEIFVELPNIVRDRGFISLNDVLRPSHSPVIGPLGLNAAPIARSLGIGTNWLIRELLRNEVYGPGDPTALAPYCWMPSRRVRELLERLGLHLSPDANKEESRAIYDFVVDHLDEDRARFGDDFDLPLQLITRAGYGDVRRQCLEQGGLDAPVFDEDDQYAEDDLSEGDST